MNLIEHIMRAVAKEPILEGWGQVKRNYVDTKKIPLSVALKLKKADPTEKKSYVEWMCKVFIDNKMRMSDIRKFSVLASFDDLKTRNIVPADKRDIGQYKTVEQLDDAVRPLEGVTTGSSIKKGISGIEDVKPEDLRFENEYVYIVDPKTEEDSCKYGKDSHWCTAAYKGDRNYFNNYYARQKGKLYYIIPFDPPRLTVDQLTEKMKSRAAYLRGSMPHITDEFYAEHLYEKFAMLVSLFDPKNTTRNVQEFRQYWDLFDRQMDAEEFNSFMRKWNVPLVNEPDDKEVNATDNLEGENNG